LDECGIEIFRIDTKKIESINKDKSGIYNYRAVTTSDGGKFLAMGYIKKKTLLLVYFCKK
jgi:hypothetical protein